MAKTDARAWMICEDIITRLKDELILEAVDILHDEIRAKRIDITGYVALLPDKSNELQRDMYIIGNLLEREPEVIEQYMPFIDGVENESDPKKVERIEELRKFMLSVKAISTLMRLSEIAKVWAEDTGRFSSSNDPEEIILNTVRMDEDRVEVLDFVLSSAKFSKSEALDLNEIGLLKKAKKAIPQRP